MNNAASFFSLNLYDAMRGTPDDKNRETEDRERDRTTSNASDADVRRQEDKSDTKKPQKNKTTRRFLKKKPIEEDVALVLESELEEIQDGGKNRKRNSKTSKVLKSK